MTRKNAYLLLSFLLLTALSLELLFWWVDENAKYTQVVFLNIGQGDAILISQGDNQIIIDGGKSGKELLSRLGRYIPFWDRHLEFVIATHPDADHIGGLPSLFHSYVVEKFLSNGGKSDTEISQILEDAVQAYSKGEPEKIYKGASITFPLGGEMVIRYPERPLEGIIADTNESSIVGRFEYGDSSFLLTGDLPQEENFLSEEQPVSVLKVAHHGSKYSSSENFLNQIRPQEAIISVGKNNYGHPDPGVLERLEKQGTLIYRTDREGDIRYICTPVLRGCKRVL